MAGVFSRRPREIEFSSATSAAVIPRSFTRAAPGLERGMHLDVIATLRRNYAAKGQVSGIGLKLATASLRHSHELCAHHNDVATTSLIEVWIDQTESRLWFLNATLNVDQA